MKRIALLAAACGALAAVQFAVAEENADYLPPSEVKWICPDEPFPDGIGEMRYYRHAFETKPGLVKATARWWVDDWGHVFIDGMKLPQSAKCTDEEVDLTALLAKPGRHVVAVEGRNLAGSGGVCLSIDLDYGDGRHESVYTDGSWRCAKECGGPLGERALPGGERALPGWTAVEFDDS